MTRNIARQIAVRLLYSQSFLDCDDIDEYLNEFFKEEHYASLTDEDGVFSSSPNKKQAEYIRNILTLVKENSAEIDENIEKNLTGWKKQRISKTALSVLRCAVCEMLYMDDIPMSVSINEAVEISKSFDSEETVAFINGVLGSVSKQISEK